MKGKEKKRKKVHFVTHGNKSCQERRWSLQHWVYGRENPHSLHSFYLWYFPRWRKKDVSEMARRKSSFLSTKLIPLLLPLLKLKWGKSFSSLREKRSKSQLENELFLPLSNFEGETKREREKKKIKWRELLLTCGFMLLMLSFHVWIEGKKLR